MHGRIAGRSSRRRMAIAGFATTATDEQDRNCVTGGGERMHQTADCRPQPSENKWRKFCGHVENPHRALPSSRGGVLSHVSLMRMLRNAVRTLCDWTPMKPKKGSSEDGRPRFGSMFVNVVVGWPFSFTL